MGIAQTTSTYEFNTSTELSNNFYDDGDQSYSETLPRFQSTGGLNNSGYIKVNNDSNSEDVDEVFISKQGYSNGGVGSIYKFSIFFKSDGVGYGGLGFQIPESDESLNTTAQGEYARSTGKVLGISFHGGGYLWHNGANNYPFNWDPVGGVSGYLTRYHDQDENGVIWPSEEWLYGELTIENISTNNFKLTFTSYKSNEDSTIYSANTSQTITYNNSDFQDADILHSYFAVGGSRISHIDRYKIELSNGPSFIEEGLPIVSGTATRTSSTISLSGTISSDRGSAITARGFVWSNSSVSPTTSDNVIASGTGTGTFSASITSASGNYHIRSYATNANGTSYGPTTSYLVPTISSLSESTAGKGAVINITGTNFTNVTGVNFGNTSAATYTLTSETSISAAVGNGASGEVSVTTLSGTATKTGFIYKVMELKFEDNVLDETESNKDGSITGTATYATGASGKAICFDNTYSSSSGVSGSSFLVIPDGLISSLSNFTISLRFKTSYEGGILSYQIGSPNASTETYVPILYIAQDGKLYANLWVGSHLTVVSSDRVDDGNWHKIEFSATPGSITTYLDGVSIGTNSGTIQHLSMVKNQIGLAKRANWPSGNNSRDWIGFKGCIDEFIILDKALTALEIEEVTDLPSPTLTSFSPTSGDRGDTITLTGTHLSGATEVRFGTATTTFTSVSSTTITAVLGKGGAGTVSVSIITAAGTASKTGFTFHPNNAPTDIALSATAIDENSASGSTIGSLSSTDADSGESFTYALVTGSGDTDNSLFSIDGSNLKTATSLDYETKNSYTILIQTTDIEGATYTESATISVNDINEAPTDLSLSNNTVIETLSSGSVIGALSTTDADSGDSYTYSLVAGTGDSDNSSFSISGGNLLSNTSFDYSVKNTYSIRVATTDSGSASYSKTFTINISPTNNAPTNISLSTNSIAENQASGSTVGALSTTDADSGDTHSYTLTNTANYPDNSSFAISGTNLISAAVFDYETKTSYTILVETSDGTATYTKTFAISITDVDEDSDGDGIPNSSDNCPSVANASQADADGDGIGDVCDNAPNVSNPSQTDTDGDGIGDVIDTDDDNDGVPDSEDAFPLDTSESTDTDGDGTGDNADPDNDNDGVLDTLDNCINTPNADQLDTDADGIGNVCDLDDDGDGFSDTDETTCGTDPLNANSSPTDTDADGTPDCIDTDDDNDGYEDNNDTFPLDDNEWLDTDQDGTGNNADADDDNDGQADEEETFCGTDPLNATSFSGDIDNDGITDCRDLDNDNDGVNDISDAFPLDPSEWTDTDGDGIGNNADEDDDNDGYSDFDELSCGSDPLDPFKKPADQDQDGLADCVDSDRDGDGYENTQDVFPDDANEWLDTDGDGLGDNFEVDDDNDGVLDSQDAFPLDPAEWLDTDGDGIGNNADTDDNNDGFEDEILFPSGVLTPNSSGLESTWKIINIEKYPNARVRVYDRNGLEVLNQAAYKNNWNGTYKDSNTRLPAGSYYYVVDLKNGEKPTEGWLYLTY